MDLSQKYKLNQTNYKQRLLYFTRKLYTVFRLYLESLFSYTVKSDKGVMQEPLLSLVQEYFIRLVAGLQPGRPVGVLPPWGVIYCGCSPWPMGTQPPLAMQALITGSLPASSCFFFYFAQSLPF